MTSALTNQRRVFKLGLTQTERVSDDVTRKIGPLDFTGILFTLQGTCFQYRWFLACPLFYSCTGLQCDGSGLVGNWVYGAYCLSK